MNLSELKISELVTIANAVNLQKTSGTFLEIGKMYMIRTITMIYTGKVKDIRGKEILLENAAWIAETERWADCVREGKFKEVEPYCRDTVINLDSFLDYVEMTSIPTEQK
jgi:hypothetical protein